MNQSSDRMWTAREVENVVKFCEILAQFGAKTDIAIHLMLPGDISRGIRTFSNMRSHLTLEEQKNCPLPEGYFRHPRGRKAVNR